MCRLQVQLHRITMTTTTKQQRSAEQGSEAKNEKQQEMLREINHSQRFTGDVIGLPHLEDV